MFQKEGNKIEDDQLKRITLNQIHEADLEENI
jgi:hypothetical protein